MNKSDELKEKVIKAEEKVTKCKATIERHIKQAEKKKLLIISKGWNPDDKYCKKGTQEYDDSYWLICEYSGKLEDIKSATRKLQDVEIILSNWNEKLSKQLKIERTLAFEMPEIFIQCQEFLAQKWTEYDIFTRELMLKRRDKMSHEEFREYYSFSDEDSLNKTDEEFNKIETRQAELWIIDLYNRVKAVTGEVTDWSNIHFSGKALAGIIKGENGNARVETISAGGYNIQRYHLRTLVHEF